MSVFAGIFVLSQPVQGDEPLGEEDGPGQGENDYDAHSEHLQSLEGKSALQDDSIPRSVHPRFTLLAFGKVGNVPPGID